LQNRRGSDRGIFHMSTKIELLKSKLRSAFQSAAETSRRGAGNSAGERERERARERCSYNLQLQLSSEESGRVSCELREKCKKVDKLNANKTQKLNWLISNKRKDA